VQILIAAVQPRSGLGADEQRNAADALDWVDRAKRAATRGVHVVASRTEEAEGGHFKA
jgi:hypothetical protein